MKDKLKLKGMVTVTVFDAWGNVKKQPKSFFRKLFNLPAKNMIYKHHNTITQQGDGLLANLLLTTPTQKKVDSENGYIRVGTGWNGLEPKKNVGVNSPTGTFAKLNEDYPKIEVPFGAEGDNVIYYRAKFEAGKLNADNINEVALMNGDDENAKCFAYAQITPNANVTSSDSLQIDWQITINGN